MKLLLIVSSLFLSFCSSNKEFTNQSSQKKDKSSDVIQDHRLVNNTVYFDFDQYNITSASKQILAQKAQLLIKNNVESITVFGHCDQVGSISYNIALGHKRAQSTVNTLKEFGYKGKIKIVSLGKSTPVSEVDYAQNRRAEIKY